MRKLYWSLFLFAWTAFVSGCIGGVSKDRSSVDEYYEQRRKSLDIISLVDTLMQHSDWMYLPNIKQIDWKSAGWDNDDPYFHDYYERTGHLYITIDSNFTEFKNGNRPEPVSWTVRLSGARMMYYNLVLENGIVSQAFSGFKEYFQQKKVLVKYREFRCGKDLIGCTFRNMNVLINNHQYTIIEKEDAALTGGPAIDYNYFISHGWTENLEALPPAEKKSKPVPLTAGSINR